MKRTPLFDTPHKALRFAFGELLNRAAKTDFNQSGAVTVLQAQMADVFSMVKSHSHHEDDICFEALDQLAPGATRHDRAEHIRLHGLLDALEAELAALNQALRQNQPQTEAGRDFYSGLCQLHADMLQHMMEEERDTQPVFWAHMSEEQIAAFEPRILSSMTPEMSALWLRHILPSQPMGQLIGMFRGMAAAMPPQVLDAQMALAREVLSAGEYAQLEKALEPAFA